jgi:hypothetical protein
MLLSAKLKLDTTQFAGPLQAAAVSSGKVAQSIVAIDPARASRAAEAFRRLSLDAASGRVQLSGTSNEMLGVADGASEVAAGMDALAMKTSQIRMLSAAFGGMALNIGGATLQALRLNREAEYLKSMGGGALQGAMVGGMSFGLKGGAIGAVVGTAAGAAQGFLGNMAEEAQAAEAESTRLAQAMENIRVGSNSAQRAIAGLESADQATATLKKMREEVAELQDRMGKGFEVGDFAGARLKSMLSLIEQVSAKEAALRASEKEKTIGESRAALGAFDVSQSDAASRRGFDKEFQSAKTSADRVALVTARMDEFGAAAAKLRERLLLPETQADHEAFSAALGRMMTISNEFTRLQGLDTKVKDQPLRPSERSASIPSDSLARIGIFVGGAGNKMESIAERTARASAQSERHLRQIASKAGKGGLVWQ